MNFTKSGLRPEIARSQSQNQSPIANGYNQGHQSFQARHKETNLLGVDTAPRGLSVLDSPIGNGPDFHQKNPLRLESTESPKNYDFFGVQQHISGQHPLQSLPKQQSGMTDTQLLQQHAIMQELLIQQLPKPRFHLPETRQLSSTNQVSTVAKQVSDGICPVPINGVPVRDALNYTWQPEHMTPNANWLQHGASPGMQGSSGGLIFSPEQSQKHLMGLVPRQVDQSFYGISTGSARGNPYQYSSVQMDKALMHQVPASSNSFPGNQYAMFSDQVGLQDGTWVSRQGNQDRNVFGAVSAKGLNSLFHSENLQQMVIQPKNAVMQESTQRKEHCSPPETSLHKSAIQVSSQNVATLDPTEEKILFGSDDSMWDVFGKSTNLGSVLDSTDSLGEFPSLQSGSWSALMQSAVAETSSNDIGVQEEWSGLGLQNCEPPSPHGIAAYDPRGQTRSKTNSWNFIESASRGGGDLSKSQDTESLLQSSQNNDHRGSMYATGHGSALDCPVPYSNIESLNVNSGLGRSPEVNREGFDQGNVASITDSRTRRVTKESIQQPPSRHNLTRWRSIDSKVNSVLSGVPSEYQQNLDKSPQTLDSSGNNYLDKGLSEANMENLNVKENSNDIIRSNFSQHTSTSAIRDNVWLDANYPLGGKQKPFIQVSHKTCGTGKFQYHPMGDMDAEVEPYYGTKSDTHMLSIPNVSEGLKVHDQGYFGQSKYTCHAAGESTGTEKGIQVDKVPFVALTSHLKRIDDSSETAQTIQLGMKSAHRTPKTSLDNGFSSSETSFPSSRTSNQNHARDPGPLFPVLEAMPISQPFATAASSQQGAFTKMLDVWTSVSSPEHLLGAKFSRASQNLLDPSSNSETNLPGTEKLDDQIAQAGNSGQSEFPTGFAKPQRFVGEEQPAKSQLVLHENNAIQNPASMQRDIEAFGRSLRPNNAVHQNYSLLHQVQAMKNTEVDLSNRSVKRFKGPPPDSGFDAQQLSSQGAEQLSYGSNSMIRDALVGRPLVPSGDSKMLSSLSKTGDNHETQLSANNMLPFVRNDSQHFSNPDNSVANVSGGHSKISPQMAPSLLDQYGAIKNGKILPIYDAQKIAMMNATEKPFIVGQSSGSLHVHSSEHVNAAADASPLYKAPKSSNFMPIANEFISPHSLPPDIANQNLVVGAKKRKSMIYEFLPWHKEVTQGSQRPQDISVAEVKWAHAANRLIEKVDNEPEMIEDWWPLVLRSKGRLVLTTHLLQQLLCAPPRVFLSADAIKNYESLAYFVTRSVLGDACSTAYKPESNTAVCPWSGSILSLKLREERNQSILEAAEEFIIREKMLGNVLQSLDKTASILDIRLECQELEKISVINRFAKFHSRGQADGSETLSSSNATVNPHKFCQRYVTALPIPKNLPDMVQCLLL